MVQNLSINHNLDKIKPNPIRAFDEQVSQVEGIIKLTLGEPDFNTPEHIKAAGIKAITDDHSYYFPTPGDLKLRQAASDFVFNKYHLTYDPTDEVIVTVGATEALTVAFQTVLNPGDKVLVPSPYFSLYDSMVTLAGGEIIEVDTSSNDFILSVDMLEKALEEHGERLKAIVLNYPTNPTGVNWTQEDAEAFANLLKTKNIVIISDEIYSELVYEGEHVSIASYLRDQTIVINGASKSHAMTGWRVGLLFAPRTLTQYLVKVHQNLVTTNTSVSQLAALEAFANGQDDALPMRLEYQRRRDYVYSRMSPLGFDIANPKGAFYIFAKIPVDLEQDSMAFCLDLALTHAVAFVPGSAFGAAGENYVRLSYAASMDNLVLAMDRLTAYVAHKRA